jgi:SP family sugar porter-like MFS transporter
MVVEDLNGMEAGNDAGLAGGGAGSSGELQKPLLLKSEGSKPKSAARHQHHHHHHHHLRSRRDAVLPNSAYAIFSTLVVALGPLSLGFAVSEIHPHPLSD